MQRPKWLNGVGKGKNHFEGSLVIDASDVKVVEADKELAFSVGIVRKVTVFLKDNDSGDFSELRHQGLGMEVFYDSSIFANLEGNEKNRYFMADMVALLSGNLSVYDETTAFIAKGKRPSKGNSPILLDFELASRIEKAKGKT
jgi:hypothetical protein